MVKTVCEGNVESEPITKTLNACEVIEYTIEVSANPPEGGTVTGGGLYAENESVTVTATPNPGFGFVNWTEGATVVSTNKTFTFTATANRTLVANFKQITYIVMVSANPTVGGAVEGGGEYFYNDEVVVTATPNDGYKFVNWSEQGVVVSLEKIYSFFITDDVVLSALFEPGTAIENIATDGDFTLYPNPTTGELIIKSEELKVENVDIFDIVGKRVASVEMYDRAPQQKQPTTTLDISNLSTGMYFVRIQTIDGMVTKKIVKQ
jgi:hypothetical protein